MDALLSQIGALPAVAVVLLMGAVMFVDASPVIGLLVPGDVAVVAMLAGSGPVDGAFATVGVVLGTMASWSLFFFLGRRVGPGLRRGRIGRSIGTRWDTAEELLAGRGARVLVLVQFLPVLNAVVPMVAGVLGMSYRQFVRYAGAGAVLWAVVFGAVGVWAGLASDIVLDGSRLGVLLFGTPGFVAGWIILLLLRRELGRRNGPPGSAERTDPTSPGPPAGSATDDGNGPADGIEVAYQA